MSRLRPFRGAVLALALAGCDPITSPGEKPGPEAEDWQPGRQLFPGHLASGTLVQEFAVSNDHRTLYVAGPAVSGAGTSIFAFDLDSDVLTSLVVGVSGFVQIRVLPGDDFLYSLSTGEVRRGGRNRTGSEATPAVDGNPKFVVSANGRFVARRTGDADSEVVDLETGVRRTAATRDGELVAIRDDGEEIVWSLSPRTWMTTTNVSTGVGRRFEPPASSLRSIRSAAWAGDTLLALVTTDEFTNDGPRSVIREVAVDLGTERLLGPGALMDQATKIAWAPAAHRAATVVSARCYKESYDAPCVSYASNITRFDQGEANVLGRIHGINESFAARLSADGKVLVYVGTRVMMKGM